MPILKTVASWPKQDLELNMGNDDIWSFVLVLIDDAFNVQTI